MTETNSKKLYTFRWLHLMPSLHKEKEGHPEYVNTRAFTRLSLIYIDNRVADYIKKRGTAQCSSGNWKIMILPNIKDQGDFPSLDVDETFGEEKGWSQEGIVFLSLLEYKTA